MKTSFNSLLGGACLIAGCAAAMPAVAADSNFYQGKTIEIVIASGPGGFDYIGRLVARHLGKHIPGNPNVVAQNMPGAGGLAAANYLYRKGRKDGTMLGQLPANIIVEDLLDSPGVSFKAAEFNMIGRVASGINLTFVRADNSNVKSISDAKNKETVLGTTAPASLVQIFPKVMNHLAGTKFRFVSGYRDSASTILAVERGEADGATIGINSLYSLRPGWVKDGTVKFLVQYTPTRSSQLPDVPAVTEFVSSPSDREVLNVFLTAVTLGQHITAPPGVPPERVKILRDAFDAMLKDPALLAEVKASHTWFDPMSGAELQKLTRTDQFSPDVIARAKAIRTGK